MTELAAKSGKELNELSKKNINDLSLDDKLWVIQRNASVKLRNAVIGLIDDFKNYNIPPSIKIIETIFDSIINSLLFATKITNFYADMHGGNFDYDYFSENILSQLKIVFNNNKELDDDIKELIIKFLTMQ